jgi:hypothetical protein
MDTTTKKEFKIDIRTLMRNYSNVRFKLSTFNWNKRVFDPTSTKDLEEYQYFIEQHHWRNGCPFYLEWPYLDVIRMIEAKIVQEHLHFLLQKTFIDENNKKNKKIRK